MTTYTAPPAMPQGGKVTIAATSVSDTTKSATASITITTPPAISLSITTPPPASMQINAAAAIAATVSNDTANKGVRWSCIPSASCGSFSNSQSASGATTTYTAAAVPPQGGTVTITATSVSDVSKTASTAVTINPIGSNATLNGQYAFLLTGQDNLGTYILAGSLTFDGMGHITTGEQDLANMSGSVPNSVTGTYTVGPDGRGTISLNFPTQVTPETFAFTITSSSHAVLNEDDGSAAASGVLDLQSAGPTFSASQLAGGYSFIMTGEDQTLATATVFGGVVTADGVSNMQNGIIDQNDSGSFTSTPFTAIFTAPDANGRGTITSSTSTATYTYYIVRPQVIRLVETDTGFVAGGTAYAQGSASGFTNSSLAGNFIFDTVGSSSTGSFAAAGQFGTDGSGNFTSGIADANDQGSLTSGSLLGTTYTFNNNPRGTITIPAGPVFTGGIHALAYLTDPTVNLLDPNNLSGGGGALVLTNDPNIAGVGLIIPQVITSQPNFAGNYAAHLISVPVNPAEIDLTGQVAVLSGKLNGAADYANDAGSTFTTPNAPFTGTFAPDGGNLGRYTGTMLITGGGTLQFVPGGAVQNVSYYQANASQFFVVETDSNVCLGFLVHQ